MLNHKIQLLLGKMIAGVGSQKDVMHGEGGNILLQQGLCVQFQLLLDPGNDIIGTDAGLKAAIISAFAAPCEGIICCDMSVLSHQSGKPVVQMSHTDITASDSSAGKDGYNILRPSDGMI